MIQPGMTFEEVASTLGGAPGDHRTGKVELDLEGPEAARRVR